MPIYEFVCHDCGKPFESLVAGFSTANVRCPDCESGNVKKKISSFAVKGNGLGSSSFNNSAASCNTGST